MKKKIIKAIEITVLIILAIIGALLEASRTFILENNQNGNIKYDFLDYNNDGVSEFLLITGNGIVKKLPQDIYENVEIIFICQGIAAVDPQAFANVQSLKFLIMPYAIYPDDIDLPMLTDLFFIEDDEYIEFVDIYI